MCKHKTTHQEQQIQAQAIQNTQIKTPQNRNAQNKSKVKQTHQADSIPNNKYKHPQATPARPQTTPQPATRNNEKLKQHQSQTINQIKKQAGAKPTIHIENNIKPVK